MPTVRNGRYTVDMPDQFVVFLIGMRINRLLQLSKWIPVARAMPRMLRELKEHPALGLLHADLFFGGRTLMTVQYWKNFELLHAYAHAKDKEHLPAWTEFNRQVSGNGSVGVFHETYLSGPGSFECIYVNMPEFGLAGARPMIPAIGKRHHAIERLSGDGVPPGD